MPRKKPRKKKEQNCNCGCFCPCMMLPAVGFALIVAKATDYLTGCGNISIWWAILGLLLILAGKMIMKKCNCGGR